MKIRYAKENETNSIIDIWNYCFNDSKSFVDYYFNDKYKSENTIVLVEDDEVVSSLQLNQYKLILNEKKYDASYVVGVSTFPQVRGRGHMKNIMKHALKELYKKDQLVSILMPIDYRLYRRYGYDHCYDQLEYNIDIEDLRRFKLKGRFYKVNQKHITDLININNNFLKGLNGYVIRDEDYYENIFKEVKSENGYIYIHEDNGYQGYITYFLNGETMFVRDLFYQNLDSLKSILKFIYNHNTQCKKVTISAPINDKIRYVLENPKTCHIKIKPFMMGRVVNLKGFIESLDINSNEECSANIYVEDEFINENNGVFKIILKNNKITVNKVEEEYEMKLNINAMTQLAFSYIDVNEVLILNNIEKSDENKNVIKLLKEIFTKRQNYINEYI